MRSETQPPRSPLLKTQLADLQRSARALHRANRSINDTSSTASSTVPASSIDPAPEDPEEPLPIMAAAVPVIPVSSHSGTIHETTRVGFALSKQATEELKLEAKFDAKPRNQKAFLHERME